MRLIVTTQICRSATVNFPPWDRKSSGSKGLGEVSLCGGEERFLQRESFTTGRPIYGLHLRVHCSDMGLTVLRHRCSTCHLHGVMPRDHAVNRRPLSSPLLSSPLLSLALSCSFKSLRSCSLLTHLASGSAIMQPAVTLMIQNHLSQGRSYYCLYSSISYTAADLRFVLV